MKKVFGASNFLSLVMLGLLSVTVVFGVLTYIRTMQSLKKQRQLFQNTYGLRQKWDPDASLRAMLDIAHKKFGVPTKGMIHLGAHQAEELYLYQEKGFKHILWVEANPTHKDALLRHTQNHQGSRVAIFAASDGAGEAVLHVPVAKTSRASLLRPKNLTKAFEGMEEQQKLPVIKKSLDSFLSEMSDKPAYNVMLLDIQGAELDALKGSINTLQSIDVVLTEFCWNTSYYEGNCSLDALDAFLKEQGFVRLETRVNHRLTDGDALYIKKHLVENKLHVEKKA
ncbi:MAG: FkbM family methyltransferase [Holosporaceae bacterium]